MAVVGLSVALGAPAYAQSTVKKVADKTHHELKKAGNGVKKGAKDVGDATHRGLQKAGNATKTEAGDVTGIHKVGGSVGKAARKVSHAGKKVGRGAKHDLKKTTSAAHKDLTKAGKDTKAAVKP
jgi:hypothetical protein